MMNSYATVISEIISFGGLSYRTPLEVKVIDLIYYITSAGNSNIELFLSKLGNKLFYRSFK